MNLLKTTLSLSLLHTILKGVHGDGCTNTITFNNTVINMCEQRSVPMGRVFINVTTDNMGSSTRCHCTLSSRTPGMKNDTIFILRSTDSHVDKCNQSLIQINPFVKLGNADLQNFTCTSPPDSSSRTGSTSDATVTLTRPDTSVGVSYCVFVHPDRHEENDMVLSCQSDLTQTTPPVSTPSSSSKPPDESLTSTTASSRDSTVTVNLSAVASGYSSTGQDFSVAPVAGGVSGAIVFIAVVIVVVVVCVKRHGRERPTEHRRHEVEKQSFSNPRLEEDINNAHYSTAEAVAMGTDGPDTKTPSSSESRPLDSMLAGSGNPYEVEDETPQDIGAVSVNTGVNPASFTPGTNTNRYPNPPGELYAVVNKPKKKKPGKPPPAKPPKPTALTTSSNAADVTAAGGGGGDLYAVVDRFRNKGGNAKKSGLPSVEATRPPVPSPPGLTYVDLAEVRGEGRRSPTRLPANMATETEYTDIDHVATAKLSSNV